MSIDELIQSIENITDGKNIHTRNTSVYYLYYFQNNKNFSKLVQLCEESLISNDWTKASLLLQRYFKND